MKVLLDTCALLWFLRDDPERSEKAARLIENSDTEAFVSVASIWEIAIKASIGKLPVPVGFQDSLEDKLKGAGFHILPVEFHHACRVYSLPPVHNDPFDRLLISQCKAEKLAAVTNDPTGAIQGTIYPSFGESSDVPRPPRLQWSAAYNQTHPPAAAPSSLIGNRFS
jgi:PIN domain nuclease of toxin-antitoxin system